VLPKAAVVVPTYNEAENLPALVKAIRALGYDLFVVDDNSRDGTGDIADRLAAADAAITVIHRPEKKGLGPAYAEGFAAAIASGVEVVCQMDADFSHDPAALPELLAVVADGADVAIGSRYVPGGSVPGWPFYRRWLSQFGNRYARFMLGTPIQDMTSGFRAYRSDVLSSLQPATCEASGYGFQVEMAGRCHEAGVRITEIPISFRDREKGDSKMTAWIAAEAMFLVTVWGLRRRIGR